MSNELNLYLAGDLMRIAEPGSERGTTFQIPLIRMAEQFFRNERLTPMSIEHAIEWTEDRLQLAKFSKPEATNLLTNDAHVKSLFEAAGIEAVAGAVLHVGAVEQIFSRLVMQANGQAPSQEALPSSGAFYASVVVVRELMHHLSFPAIRLSDPET